MSNDIKNRARHNAKTIKTALIPVGYSSSSPFNSDSIVVVFWSCFVVRSSSPLSSFLLSSGVERNSISKVNPAAGDVMKVLEMICGDLEDAKWKFG